ncbi:hypothetical protein NHQ30_008541 [Ciborinia camelliae]|nr:hypothetical protein NHQ30_008541 [Ciborinia camelliae]
MEVVDQQLEERFAMLNLNAINMDISSQSDDNAHQTQITMPPQPAASFTLFAELPPELKAKIINFGARLTARLIEITTEGVFKGQTPALLSVNHFTREEALRVYVTLQQKSPQPVYFNPDNDTFLLNIETTANFDVILSKFSFSCYRKWVGDGKVKSFAVKPEFNLPNRSRYNESDLHIIRNYSLSLTLILIDLEVGKGDTYTLVSSSTYDIGEFDELLYPENYPQWIWASQYINLRALKMILPNAVEEESTFYSKFGTAENN